MVKVTRAEGFQQAYVGEDGEIRELWMPRTGKWTYTDLSALVLALPARF